MAKNEPMETRTTDSTMNALAEAQLDSFLKQRQRLLWNQITTLFEIEPWLQTKVHTWIDQQTLSQHRTYVPGGARTSRSPR